jgi:hypothetical protein
LNQTVGMTAMLNFHGSSQTAAIEASVQLNCG